MADNPFDRVIFHPLEKPLSQDWNRSQSDLDRALRYFAKFLFSDNVTGSIQDGFIKNSFQPVEDSPAAMSVIVKAGLGFQNDVVDVPTDIDGILGLDDVESYKPVPLIADVTFTVPVAPVGPNTRIDIIEVRAERDTENSLSRQFLNPATGAFSPSSVDKTLAFALDGKTGVVSAPSASTAPLSYKVGVAANPGVAPATTAGYIKIAEIAVGSGVVVINDADITDLRFLIASDFVEVAGDTMTGRLSIQAASDLGTEHLGIETSVRQSKALRADSNDLGVISTLGRFGGKNIGSPIGSVDMPLAGMEPGSPADAPDGWTEFTSGNALFDWRQATPSGAPDANMSGSGGDTSPAAGAGENGYARWLHLFNTTEGAVVLEFWNRRDSPAVSNQRHQWGISDVPSDSLGGVANQAIFFELDASTDVLIARSDDGAVQTDTPLGAVDSAVHCYRIEWIGDNVGGPEQRFYIDNVLVATHSLNIPQSDMRPYFGSEADAAFPANDLVFFHWFRCAFPISDNLIGIAKP